MSNKLTVCSCK